MSQKLHKILWIDDEVEALLPHRRSLETRGYDITAATNGEDGIELLKQNNNQYDAILLDQVMPGKDGMETLDIIRTIDAQVPVILVTQSSDDKFVDVALGKQVTDFLVKPIGVAQIASTLKRVLEQKNIVETQIPGRYTYDFNTISTLKASQPSWQDWIDIYVKLLEWDLLSDQLAKQGLEETHIEQKKECNAEFSDFVEANYQDWVNGDQDRPTLSVDILDQYVMPLLQDKVPIYFIVVDCFRLDHWMAIEPLLHPYFSIDRNYSFSILPSATMYSRNALFSGLFPAEIAKDYPQYWQEKSDDGTSTNQFERQLLEEYLKRNNIRIKPGVQYFKIFDLRGGIEYKKRVAAASRVGLSALVVNFIDILTHQRSQSEVLQQLAPDEPAFRALARSWFAHSALFDILRLIADQGVHVVLTTDHGSEFCNRATRAYGNRETSTSLRFKIGNNLNCDENQAVYIPKPKEYQLPAESSSKDYILAKDDYYFVYPNDFYKYKRQFQGGFQHGGISMGELITPVVTLTPRNG
ncbi:MAG: bifunctional response regulator/alkaline phosphatase family protein [Candidatus Poribacteria bacterium]|nr:bifunctional response regulator/alkaline phosphatase family protein [Candidatus Poribacteria bacterium]